ncbi:MAG: two-component system, OmpR family, alkaline phosphatase synthesis response regulator PhoP [Actinomycetota bacterium]|jgi:DNA-binding response OmpR family regulator/DNA-binding CsgD family transcriptional regulator|nr:two-component system, OmpR family, alkaline phosphatase synthesis response regulator PhoP [Actinomycetota bacterium]
MGTVLVVDDEPDIRELVRLNLEIDGHTVFTAGDGAEALELAVGEHPDLVVLDVMMPEKDGWEVLAEMKASIDPVIAHIPVIMLTARADDMDRIRGGIEGAIRYVTKPFSPAELRKVVNDAMTGDPEPERRRRIQNDALEQLARLESGAAATTAGTARAARPHITRLERAPEAEPVRPTGIQISPEKVVALSDKQRELLGMVGSTPTVSEAAERLSVSRSNVYASLRRIARKLEVRSVPELVTLVRAGGIPVI